MGRFKLGRHMMSAAVACKMAETPRFAKFVAASLRRHANCDWGDMTSVDKKANDNSVKDGSRILSAYKDSDGTKIYIITEADRSYTTIIFPEDY